MKRPVHYHAAGMRGLAFNCYWADYERHRASEDPAAPEAHRWQTRTVPMPLRHTDLAKVTCRECWGQILILARQRGAK